MKPLTALGFALACVLSGVAGFVDAIGFLHLGGLFVSFMSGNTTRIGVSLGHAAWDDAARFGASVALFFVGTVAGSLLGGTGTPGRRGFVLLGVSACLALAAHLAGRGVRPEASGALMVLAMGAENAVFQRGGAAGLGLTYVTGALVKAGQGVAAALTGGSRTGWVPSVLLWSALLAGGAVGALAFDRHGLAALWAPALAALVLAPLLALATRRGHAG